MVDLPQSDPAIDFSWSDNWLTGEQYAHILRHSEVYCTQFHFKKYGPRQHPITIYEEPFNGLMYFVEGDSIASEFGFPRVDMKKKFRWKKMNFTTELPKRKPLVSYIVASAVKSEKFFPNCQNEGPAFRMHAVVLIHPEPQSFVLCHIRKLSDADITPLPNVPAPLRIKRTSPSPHKKRRKEKTERIDGLWALLEAAKQEAPIDNSFAEDLKPPETTLESAADSMSGKDIALI